MEDSRAPPEDLQALLPHPKLRGAHRGDIDTAHPTVKHRSGSSPPDRALASASLPMRPSAVVFLCGLLSLGCDSADVAPAPPSSDTRGPGATIDPALRYAAMCASCHGEAGEGGLGSRLVDSARSVEAAHADHRRAHAPGKPRRLPRRLRLVDRAVHQDPLHLAGPLLRHRRPLGATPPPPHPPRVPRDGARPARLPRPRRRPTTPPGADPACGRHRFAYAPPAPRAASTSRELQRLVAHRVAHDLGRGRPRVAVRARARRRRLPVQVRRRRLAVGERPARHGLDARRLRRSELRAHAPLRRRRSAAPASSPRAPSTRWPRPPLALPVESRPQGFAFDNNADSALVTSVHVNEYLRAGRGSPPRSPRGSALSSAARRPPTARPAPTPSCGASAPALPPAAHAAEMQRYGALVTGARDVDQGVTRAVRAMLLSPSFLYRSEMGVAQPDGTFRLTPYEVAAALSYTYWGSTPDAALLAAAADGSLSTPAGTEREARRLLADPRAREQLATFALQWLGVETVATTPRSAALFPAFTDAVRASMLEEARRLVTSVAFDGTHRFDELFTTRSTWVDATLAATTARRRERQRLPAGRAPGGAPGRRAQPRRGAHPLRPQRPGLAHPPRGSSCAQAAALRGVSAAAGQRRGRARRRPAPPPASASASTRPTPPA
jgi:hypothetical protein